MHAVVCSAAISNHTSGSQTDLPQGCISEVLTASISTAALLSGQFFLGLHSDETLATLFGTPS
jgi:hypothetical protein